MINDKIIIDKLSKYKNIPWKFVDKEIIEFLEKRFNDSSSIYESWFRIKNKIYEVPKCVICGKKAKFTKWKFSETCADSICVNKNIKNKREKTCLEKYGVINPYQSTQIKEKIKQTNLNKYGVEYPMQNVEQQQKAKKTCKNKYGYESISQVPKIKEKKKKTRYINYPNYISDKQKQTNIEKYGCETPFGNKQIREKSQTTLLNNYGVLYPQQNKKIQEKTKQTCLKLYGVESPISTETAKINAHTKEAYIKAINTRKQNGTYKISNLEEKSYNLLLEVFDKEDIKRQYYTPQYPFNCDFYIVSEDMYIECHYFWMHGFHKFGTLESDYSKLNEWKEKSLTHKAYKQAIYTWFDLDIRKYEISKINKLNIYFFYTFDEFENFIINLKNKLNDTQE